MEHLEKGYAQKLTDEIFNISKDKVRDNEWEQGSFY